MITDTDKSERFKKMAAKHFTEHLLANAIGTGVLALLRGIGAKPEDVVLEADEQYDWNHRPPTATEVAKHEAKGGLWRVIIDDSKGLCFECTMKLRVHDGVLETRVAGDWMPTQDKIILCRPVVLREASEMDKAEAKK